MNRILSLILIQFLMIITIGCSGGSETVGGSIEISNGYIAGTVLNSKTHTEGGVVVKLIPSTFNPLEDNEIEVIVDTTDSTGFYEFSNLESGTYNIILRDSLGQNALLIDNFKVYNDSRDTIINSLKSIGRIIVDVSAQFNTIDGYLYFEGTDVLIEIPSGSDTVSLSIPAGFYCDLTSISSDLSNEKTLSNEVLVVSDKDINLPYEFTVLMIDIDSTDNVNILAEIISEMGGMPVIKSSSEFKADDTVGIDLIYISYYSDLDQDDITLFKYIDKPVICSKAEYFQGLGFTVGTSNIYGYEEHNRAIIDIDTHAITQGFFAADSSVEIYKDASSMPLMAWGSVWGSCTRIANGTLSQNHRVWFTFDIGDEMNGLNAPANRAGIAITKGRALHDSGIILFKNTINWAIK